MKKFFSKNGIWILAAATLIVKLPEKEQNAQP